MHDIYVNGTGWSSIEATGGSSNIIISNITVYNSGHNGLDLHGCNDILVENMNIYDSISNNVLITGPGAANGTYNVTLKNMKSYGSTPGSSYRVGVGVHDIIFENIYSETGDSVVTASAITNLTVINATAYSNTEGIIFTYSDSFSELYDVSTDVTNGYIIDSNLCNQGYPNIYLLYSTNSKFINVKYDSLVLDTRYNSSETLFYYYPDVLVKDTEGTPISSAIVSVSNIFDTPLSISVDGLGNDKNTFVTELDGKLSSPVINRSNSLALAEFYKNSAGTNYYFSHELSINSKYGNNVILSDITPDSSWYRKDPNIPSYTITAIIPDSSSTGPQITGYAPSPDNPFELGEKKKFQVWTDEELTTMKWYINGNLVLSGSMDYTWDILSGTNTIMFTGSNANGAVVQTWEITEETTDEEPVFSGTGLSFTPSATSLTATTGESATFSVDTSQEFTSAVWSLDGVEVEAGTTDHVESWTTEGTHTVTFDGTAAAGTISRTWTVIVSAAAESEYSSISISPSTTTVAPGESFSLDVYIDPTQALTGSQFDLQYSQLASISTVSEGDMFTSSGLATTFQYDSIDNAAGLLDKVYAAIVGSGSIISPGAMATIEMVAGSSSGILDLGLSDVILSDANSNPAGYTVSNATVLIDTAPQFTSVSSQTVVEGQGLSFTVSATDADADELTYTATTLPFGATFNGGSFSWTPSEGDAGSYVASFEVTDAYLTDTVNVNITVTPMNHMPEITLFEPADSSVFEEGSTIDVNVAANDADGDSLSYIIEIDGVQVSTSASYSWTTDYESAGTHTIKVTVSDGTEEVSSSSTITITDLQPRWDVNEDGIVNVLDITLVGQNYGKTYTTDLPRWDVNQDGTVNIQDLSIVSGHFGETV
ncbi:dockerin type I domain-containing protein [Methanolobus sediminis]|uniref:Probable pectate lyase C n=1 Tax=Methanolobus sediminis TaxID=3072978 RepID=A0AA51YMB6_9EURY|nr:dockerin type I domain-containing protein [Methanolobus sediminis]WMW25423.1 dockerin type I domain-containing protein [Methanolobus sediminis]